MGDETSTARVTEPPRAWQGVLEHIEAQLLDGRLAPGDRLPGERALASDLGVGRSSVREALRVLEVLGLIRTQAGSGPTAGAIIIATPGGGMSALMRLQVAARGFPVADIVRTRLILEASVVGDLADAAGATAPASPASAPASPASAPALPAHGSAPPAHGSAPPASAPALPAHGSAPPAPAPPAPGSAAGRGTPHALTAAELLLDAMDSPALTSAEFLALDAAFHLALAEASGNQVITATMAGLRSGIEGYALEGLGRIDDWHATSTRLRSEHRGILAAIRAADAPAARTRIHDHIAGYYAEAFAPEPTPRAPLDPTPSPPAGS